MASIDELKGRIDCIDLAHRLGLERPQKTGNWRSPHHADKSPSVQVKERHWKDYSSGEHGDCIDLVAWVLGCSKGEAIRWLHEAYAIPFDRPKEAPREKSTVEYIADRCLEEPGPVVEYLKSRGIPEEISRRAIARKSLGWNTWTSSKAAAGEFGYGGPAAAFIVRTLNPGHVVAVDMRYVDPALNGNVKTQSQGEKHGAPWTSDLRRLQDARTVFVVESAINALSVETCDLPYAAAIATRGTATVDGVDWRVLHGKRVIACFDNDAPDDKGRRAGPEAAWRLHEVCTAVNVPVLFVDQDEWEENDVNDVLQKHGAHELTMRLKRIEDWLIPGMPGRGTEQLGRPRIYLPGHDFAHYWRYRVKDDFTSFVTKVEKNDETGIETPSFKDLCGFRIAAISRVSVASSASVMSGDPDQAPTTYFAVSVQAPRHGPRLMRRVIEDERLHNIEHWKKFGPVFDQGAFLRMVNILERTADIGARKAANFVGLAWREGKLVVNEGPDTYFTEPEKQCPYHNLSFPSGSLADARTVISAYQTTFSNNAAAIALVWALGGHMKALTGFWPHLIMQADKGAGKSTLIKRLERSLAFTMFSGQSLMTEFRMLTSISHTSHPVGWEELSARRQEVIDKAVAMLQEAYQFTTSRRGSEMTEYLLCAPVMLAGEDVPVRSLLGKVVRAELRKDKQGPLVPEVMPRFPVRQWLEHLARQSRTRVHELLEQARGHCQQVCRATGKDAGASRMVTNYSAVLAAWRLLAEFAGIDRAQGDFETALIAEMNGHIGETSADREPWVWIVEILLSELASGTYRHPALWDEVDGVECLLVRTSHVMDHLAHSMWLREKWNGLPVKSDRVFKKQITQAGVVLRDAAGAALDYERKVGDRRVSHMTALDLTALQNFGLYAAPSGRSSEPGFPA